MSAREQQAQGLVFTQRTFCLGKQGIPANKMLQTATRVSVFLSGLLHLKVGKSPWQMSDNILEVASSE